MASINFKHTPFGDLALISMRGCEDIASQVDYYLKQWRSIPDDESFDEKVASFASQTNMDFIFDYIYSIIFQKNYMENYHSKHAKDVYTNSMIYNKL